MIAEGARRRGEEAKEASKEAYERLIGVARASLKQASKVRQTLRSEEAHLGGGRLADELERFEGLIEQVVDQSERRVLNEESVAAWCVPTAAKETSSGDTCATSRSSCASSPATSSERTW